MAAGKETKKRTPKETARSFRFREVADLIEKRMRGLAPGDRLPSSTEWRLKLGVSRTTIARAFSELKARGLLDARAGIGTKVAKPNRSRLVLVLWEGEGSTRGHSNLAAEFLTGAAMAATEERDVLVSHLPADHFGPDWDPLHEFPGLSGVLFFRCPELQRSLAPCLDASKVPHLLYGSSAYVDPVRGVAVDEASVARLALEALASAGCERIGFVLRSGHAPGEERRRAWRDWHRVEGRRLVADRALEIPGFERPESLQGFDAWLSSVDGVWASSDSLAVRILEAARKRGRKSPEDFKIVGVDDQALLDDLDPGISSVDIPLKRHAALCLELLLRGEKGRLLSDGRLVRRGSCG